MILSTFVYFICGWQKVGYTDGMLLRKTRNGKPIFRDNVTDTSKLWITDDKIKAEDMCYELTRKGFVSKYALGHGVVEVPNKDGMYDEDLKSMAEA